MENRCALRLFCSGIFIVTTCIVAVPITAAAQTGTLLTGKAAMGDWKSDAPGVQRKITVADLPPPTSNILAINPPRVARRPADAQPQIPPGFKIELYASGFRDPRFLLSAPNGDIFVVESRANRVKVLRDTNGDGKPDLTETFAERDLNKPLGIAFYPPGDDPQFLYVANTDDRWRNSVSVSQRRSQSAWVSRTVGRASFWRRGTPAQWRTLDSRHCFFARWEKNVRLNRFALECFR
jgi:glucose/arabinose dehydrogenase